MNGDAHRGMTPSFRDRPFLGYNPAMIVNIGLIQMSCSPEPEENLAGAVRRIREAADGGAQIVCLPELFRSRYFCQSEDYENFALAESIPGPTTDRLSELARALDVVLIVPLFERRGPGVYHNSAAVIDAGGRCLGTYRKMHIPDDPLYYEKFYFAPGDLGFRVWETRWGRISVLICWDQWFPEAARLAALGGAQMLFYPTAIGWHPAEKSEQGITQHAAWETVQRAHAIANGLYVAAVNRTGREDLGSTGIEFWGASFVCDPMGTVLARAAHDREATLTAACDLSRVETVRTHWPFLRDRRLDAYADITRRYLE